MSTVRIMLLPDEEIGNNLCFSRGAARATTLLAANKYRVLEPMTLEQTGADAAEEIFDLLGNPGRQDEREEKYGRGRALIVGDLVEVDGVKWACLSMGWAKVE